MNKELLANINRRHHFDEKEGLEILNLPELNLSPEEEMEIFDFPEEEATDLFIKYITRIHTDHYNWKLCDEAEVKIFDFSPENIKKIMPRYVGLISPAQRLCPEAELKIFNLPGDIAKEIIFRYTEWHILRSEAKLKIFNLPIKTVQEIMIKYAQRGTIEYLPPKVQIMIFDHPEIAKEIWKNCHKSSRQGFCFEARKKASRLGLSPYW